MDQTQQTTAPSDTVYNIQRMLMAISRQDPRVLRVNPTGIYGEETVYSVESYQRARGLPVTGEVDQETFDTLASEYIDLQELSSRSRPIYPFERRLVGGQVSPGDAFDLVLIIQIIMDYLSLKMDNIENSSMNGVFDEQTRRNVERFQKISNLPVTGNVDRATWDQLADFYNTIMDTQDS